MPKPHGNKLINRYATKTPTDMNELQTYEIKKTWLKISST